MDGIIVAYDTKWQGGLVFYEGQEYRFSICDCDQGVKVKQGEIVTLHFSKHCKTGKNYIAHISPKQNKRKRIGFIKCNNTEEEKKKEEISYVASSTEWLDDFCESIKLKIKIQFKDDDFFYSYTYENIIDIDSFILIITNHFKLPFCPQFRYWNEKGDQEALTTTMVLQNLINAKAKQDEIIGRDSFLKIFVDFALPK